MALIDGFERPQARQFLDGLGITCRVRRSGWSALLAGICLLIAMQLPAMAQSGGRQTFDLGTAPPDGLSHPLGVSIAALIKLKLLPRTDIDIDARNTLGSRDNAIRLRSGDLDFGILSTLDAYQAFGGTGPFADVGEDPSLRTVTNLWTSSFHFVIRPGDVTTGSIIDFLGLRGKRVALGANGSSLRGQASDILAALGIDVEEAYQLQNIAGPRAAEAFLDGDLDGFLLVDERQGADLAVFLDRAGDRAAVLAAGDDAIDRILDDGAPAWIRTVIPKGSFPGQSEAYPAIGLRNVLATSGSVADDAVYQITRTLFDNLPFLREMHSATIGIDLETALEQIVLPVHEGAATYYREVGVTVEEPRSLRKSTLAETAFLTRYDTVDQARENLGAATFTILGGQAGHTTARMLGELAAELIDADTRLVSMSSPKPADNIADVLYARGVDGAIIPLNILSYALERDIYPDLQRKITYLTDLFQEEVHLLVSDSVGELDDLIDRPINLGPRGSVSEFTASFLLDQLDMPVEPTYHDDRTALALLAKGELAAVFMVAGKPMPLLSEIADDPGFRLLAISGLQGDAYRAATISAADYPNLLSPGEVVETFGVRTVLLSYNWRPDNPRFQALSTFIDAFFERLPDLQRSDVGQHPKWQEIDPLRDVPAWQRSPAAQNWIERQGSAGQPADTEEQAR